MYTNTNSFPFSLLSTKNPYEIYLFLLIMCFVQKFFIKFCVNIKPLPFYNLKHAVNILFSISLKYT